ncbi:hypothetical protein D9757_008250 [Collybiopsis confluens]|uniref:Uncharacterized protein n=1 Tax=Collybiopsis confluens TaxID=2823264 RepID=A0A8H5CGU4_9AGAR|nr:hypothetical protein D9757_014787 [Collybiopsis confluens]KAF5374593.1 hypothetical protein D9757_010190 [Collybiopsis confluens]KAF5380245.1 hypothetical protein D9757_008250 [Collybiopsis confluens]
MEARLPDKLGILRALLKRVSLLREFTVGDKEVFNPAVNLTRDSIQFLPSFENPSYVRLTLPESKTDPFRKGVSILIAAVPHSPFCAVTALKNLFSIHLLPSSSPLFAMTDGRPMSRSFFVSTLKSQIEAVGIDSTGYSGHSFCRGAATSAAAAGYSDYEIQLLGRWRSDAYITVRPSELTEHETSWIDSVLFATFFFSAMYCQLSSAMFHSSASHSLEVCTRCQAYDYIGITVLNLGSHYPLLYYGFSANLTIRSYTS